MSVTLFHNTPVMTQHQPPKAAAVEEPTRLVGIEARLKGHPVKSTVQTWRSRGSLDIPVKPDSLWAACTTVVVEEDLLDAEVAAEYGEKVVRAAHAKTPAEGSLLDPDCADIYWSAGTWRAAKTAAAAAVQAVQAALRCDKDNKDNKDNKGNHAFALVRPPGHHCFDVPAGFCILNNVVLAARRAMAAGKRVAIVDWDYHFGDGTAAALWGEEAAMVVSLHAARTVSGFPTYPATVPRDFKGAGLRKATGGRCFNIQWAQDDADDAAAAYAFQHLLLPALRRFAPDIILVSAGYDALKGDDLAGMQMTPGAFRYLAAALASLGPVVAVLEGGYNVELLAEGVAETIQGLLQAPPDLATWLEQVPQERHKAVVDKEAAHVFGQG